MEPIQLATSSSFASGIMKIQLRFGFCHTIVLDKDSKFFGVFKEAVNLLLDQSSHPLWWEPQWYARRTHQLLPQQMFEDYDQRMRLCLSCYGGHPITPLCME